MKKIVFLAAFLTLALVKGQAQDQDFRFGFQVSPTFSWMKTDETKINGNGTNLGLRLGVLGEKYFRENYALLFGIGFAFNQGGTLKHDFGGNLWPNSDLSDAILNTRDDALPNGVNLKYGLQFIELPFALKMRTNEFGHMRAFFEIPRFTIGINTQARGAIEGLGIDVEKEKIEKDVNFLNLSWGIGGGVEYQLGDGTALVGGLFFQQGFLDLTKDKNTVRFDTNERTTLGQDDSKGTISSITLRIGLMF
ncbi:MAG: outer membrane beta-barrel protein [Bacteroidota bacterium]